MAKLEETVRIPSARIAILIGEKGKTKKLIEKKTKTKVLVDSEEGNITVSGKMENTTGFYSSLDIIKAIGRGFSPEHALLLLQENYSLEILSLLDWFKGSEKELKTKRGRVIGREGKARKEIEQKTDCFISIQGKTIAIIGEIENVSRARKAVEMLLEGARHAKVFEFLDQPKKMHGFDF